MHKKSFDFRNIIPFIVKNEKKIYVILGILIVFLWLSFAMNILNLKKIIAFSIFVLIGGFFKYMISRFRIFFEFTPILFFSVIIAKYMGFVSVIIYLILADLVPSYLGHMGPDDGSFPHWIWVVIFSMVAIPFDISNIFFRLIAPLIYFGGCLFVDKILLRKLGWMSVGSGVAVLVINAYFFIQFGPFFVSLMA